MVGAWCETRSHEWVKLAMVPLSEMDRHLSDAWADHGDALMAEAQSYGFEPYSTHDARRVDLGSTDGGKHSSRNISID